MQLVLSLLLATILVLLYFWRPKTRRQGIKLQGPQGKGLLSTAPYGQLQSEWFDTYGHTLAYRNDSDKLSILTCDPAAVAFIHREHDSILQPASIKSFALKNMGPSLMGVEGAAHRRQRRVIAPAFGSKAIRAMTPTFLSMAIELKNKLLSTAGQEIDVTTSIHQLTVDAIGSVAFGCEFGALAGGGHELLDVFYRMTSAAQPSEKDQAIEAAHVTMHRIGSTLVKQRTEQILAETAGGPLDKKSISANDVLTNLLRANMATDVAEDQRLSDEEVAAQIPLFLFAGNTTVAVTLDWASALLARYPDCSAQLFAETDEIGSDNPSWCVAFYLHRSRQGHHQRFAIPRRVCQGGAETLRSSPNFVPGSSKRHTTSVGAPCGGSERANSHIGPRPCWYHHPHR
ncbi:cytochrome P450 [Kockovaella imperatae]|uniref:Cytochrome P450 n=1 Tax=Kockovaella imperatae TaxID=4999 RepID=A0A1Y1UK66_9TREE|nr:cytochrome P450 [Kockovaella imperatae]ORX37515.1 cytochrome P450 [Kockovaella imperatae]